MGLSGLGVAAGLATAGPGGWARLVSTMLYPVGFIAVIVGRSQLFTENTLYPVVVLFERRDGKTFGELIRLWTIVFAMNIVGIAVFALLAVRTGGLEPGIVDHLVGLGRQATNHAFVDVFVSGIFGGWLVALVAGLVSAAQRTIGQIVIIWILTFMLGLAHFAHSLHRAARSSPRSSTARPDRARTSRGLRQRRSATSSAAS